MEQEKQKEEKKKEKKEEEEKVPCPNTKPICFIGKKENGEYKLCVKNVNEESYVNEESTFFDKLKHISEVLETNSIDTFQDKSEFCNTFDFAWLNAISELKRNLKKNKEDSNKPLEITDEVKQKNIDKINTFVTQEAPFQLYFKLIHDVMIKNREKVVNDQVKKYITVFCNCIQSALPNDINYDEVKHPKIELDEGDETMATNIKDGIEILISIQTILKQKILTNEITYPNDTKNIEQQTKLYKETLNYVDRFYDIGKYLLEGSNQFDKGAFKSVGELFGELLPNQTNDQSGGGVGALVLGIGCSIIGGLLISTGIFAPVGFIFCVVGLFSLALSVDIIDDDKMREKLNEMTPKEKYKFWKKREPNIDPNGKGRWWNFMNKRDKIDIWQNMKEKEKKKNWDNMNEDDKRLIWKNTNEIDRKYIYENIMTKEEGEKRIREEDKEMWYGWNESKKTKYWKIWDNNTKERFYKVMSDADKKIFILEHNLPKDTGYVEIGAPHQQEFVEEEFVKEENFPQEGGKKTRRRKCHSKKRRSLIYKKKRNIFYSKKKYRTKRFTKRYSKKNKYT